MRKSVLTAASGQPASSKWSRVAVAAAASVLFLGTFAMSAAAETINFADLGPGCSPAIPAVYHGLAWSSNLQVECNADYASSYGNSYGAPSGYAITNGSLLSGLSEISVSTGTFDFASAAFSSFAGFDTFQPYSALSLQIYAYRPGDAVDSPTFATTLDLDPTQYVSTVLNWTGITNLFFGAGNGPAADSGTTFGVDGLSWLMTDVEVNTGVAVPEPASRLLLGTGLIGVAFILRRRITSKFSQQN